MSKQRMPEEERHEGPISVIAAIAEEREWAFDQRHNGDNAELSAQIPGKYCDLTLCFSWNNDLEALHFSCALDLKIPPEKYATANDLLGRINEKLWLGSFSVWSEQGIPMFRQTLLLHGITVISEEMIDTLVGTAAFESDRYYPAIQFLLWGGKSPSESLQLALVDTVGEA